MTLRDCTVFVRFPDDPTHDDWAIEARIGDLDLKSTRKLEYWQSLERALITEGWYEGTEQPELAQPLTCALSRK
jgi:inositol-pentakisphosphate 2-kinase